MKRNPLGRRSTCAVLSIAAALAAAALAPSLASAGIVVSNSCSVTLTDSVGGTWDLNDYTGYVDGSVSDGSLQPEDRSDAYDRFTTLNISADGGTSWSDYRSDDPAAGDLCTTEDNGRELVMPPVTIDGLSVYRKIYVPDTGLAFARFASVISNPTDAPITVSLDIAGGRNDNGDLGSDSSTFVSGSSSGDAATTNGDMTQMTTDDDWATTADDPDPSDPALAHVWQSRGEGIDAADQVGVEQDEADELYWQYDNVTIQPGQTVIYLSFEAMRRTVAESIDAAKAIAAEPEEAYAGLSDTELEQVANFALNDRDRDGVINSKDNCPTTANADQADMDGDGKGDVCDTDIDGDGLGNGSEEEFGTNPRSADSDGDGVQDKADACPTKAGKGEDGCPVAEFVQQPADTTAPNAQIATVAGAKNLADLLNGITVTLTCDEACEARVRALGRMPTGSAVFSVIGGFNRVLGRTYSPLAAGKHKVRVRPCERKPGGPQSKACLKRLRKAGKAKRSFLVKVYVLAEDRAGNTKETSKLIRVKRA